MTVSALPRPVRRPRLDLRRPAAVWLLVGAMALVGLAIAGFVAPWPALAGGPIVLPWWALLPLFYLAEVRVIHLQTQRETQSFTLIELPLVAGLFLATPADLVLAAVLGAGTGLVLHRRPVAIKLAFNLVLFLLSTSLAVLIFRGLIGAATPLDPIAWLATFAATVTSTGVGLLAVTAAIVLAQGRTDPERLVAGARFGLAMAATNTALGLIGITLLWMAPGSAWLLAIPAMLVAIAWRGYRADVAEREGRERLELLYVGTRILHGGGDVEPAIEALLLEARRTFRAEVAELILSVADDHDAGLRTIVGPGDEVSTMASVRLDPVADAMHLGAVRRGATVAVAPMPAGAAHPDRIGATPVRDALVAPLTGERGVIGSIIIANRQGSLGTFRPDEMRLFETLANHAGVALENGRLGRSLSDLRAVKDQLRHQALHDSLTGLGNRDLLLERLGLALSRRSPGGPLPVVLFIDLDDFKSVNDTLGHAVGDELLRSVAMAIRGATRPTDLAVRLAGDEFGVVIEDGRDLRAIIRVAERIIESVRRPVEIEGHWIAASASIGIATAQASRQSADDLLRDADLAMYAAKGRGKGRFALFDPELRTEITERQRLRDELSVAVARGELALRYQPVSDLATGAIVGLEALLRWHHPERGELAPGAFLQVAEESGLILPIGRWVLREACRAACSWDSVAGPGPAVHVNLSVHQLRDADIVADVAGVLGTTGLDPARLTLELGEAQLMTDDPAIATRLAELKGLGIRLAIDGFGLGFLSVAALGRYPVDVIKIARPVVNAMGRTPEDARIAEAIVALGRSLHLEVVAEGVESLAQLDRVRGLRVDRAQGFHIGAPVAASAVLAMLAGRPRLHAGGRSAVAVAVG